MRYVIVNKETNERARHCTSYWQDTPAYKSEGSAKAAMKRYKMRDGSRRFSDEEYHVMSLEDWKASGGKNTIPACCDPSTETYWCM